MNWMIVPGNPALSALVLFLVATVFLYAARVPMHGLINNLLRTAAHALRLAARWLGRSAEELRARNRVVLLARGREEVAQAIEREFERVTKLVQRDLHGYPQLQRKLMDEITKIEEDYAKCGEVPPPPPAWTKAVSEISKLKGSGDGLVEKILEDIADSIEKIYDKVVGEYRAAFEERHKILGRAVPFWRSVDQSLKTVDRDMSVLQESAAKIDAQMEKYEKIAAKSQDAEQALTSSATVQFVIATIVLVIAFGGALVNFKLIALPMSAMVGAGDYVWGSLQASDIAALVIIFIEATMGLFLMETLRFTHLFPRINNLHDRQRIRLMWVAFTILLVLAGVEVGLAVMRDWIVQANLNLLRSLNPAAAEQAAAAAAQQTGWVHNMPIAAQMILGFTLPFALAFMAIPLEYFIHSARTVVGVALVLVMRSVSFVLRFTGNVFYHAGRTLVAFYDALIFIPLLIERGVRGARGGRKAANQDTLEITTFPPQEQFRRTGGKGL